MRFSRSVSFLLCIVFLFLLFVPSAFTQEMDPNEKNASNSSSLMFVKYDLAYPGILPDSRFYKLKVLRDKISLGLISNPRKKIEFLLLQTDKGILATAMLVDKKKIDLAKETVLKAENNYTMLTYELYNLGKKPEESFFKKLQTASLKHQEILESLKKRVSENDAKVFDTVIEFSKRNWNTVEQYKKGFSIM